MLNFIAIHPAGLGDALEDLILFKAILKNNENVNIHYLGNHFSTELVDLSESFTPQKAEFIKAGGSYAVVFGK